MTDEEIEALMRATYTSGYPDDLRRLVARVRRDALEKAARLCESSGNARTQTTGFSTEAVALWDAADAIRALAIHVPPTCIDSGKK